MPSLAAVVSAGESIAPSAFAPANPRVRSDSEAMYMGNGCSSLTSDFMFSAVKKSPLKERFSPSPEGLHYLDVLADPAKGSRLGYREDLVAYLGHGRKAPQTQPHDRPYLPTSR